MASLGVLASGDGSNFQALVDAARVAGHEASLLVCDKPGAFVLTRAKSLGVKAELIAYAGRSRSDAENAIAEALESAGVDIIALAGFMRILGEDFVDRFAGKLINVHPSLLPAWPGVNAIRRAWEAGETEIGATVHYVDRGMDTGPIILQARVRACASFLETEAAVHAAEHSIFPRVAVELLDAADARRANA